MRYCGSSPRGRRGPGADATGGPRGMVAWLLLATIGLTACGDAGSAAAGPAVRDSAGVRIVENRGDPGGPPPPAGHLGEPEAVIGARDEDALHGIGGVVRLSDGTVVVADNGARVLRFHPAASGTPTRVVGRRGAGPGEFEQLDGLFRFAADSLAVWDPRLARLTVLDASGTVARTVRPVPPPNGEYFPVLGVFRDGSFLATDGVDFGAIFAGGTRVLRVPQAIRRYAPDGRLLDTLAVFPGDERFAWVEGTGFALRPLPFGRRLLVAVAGERVYTATGDAAEIGVSHGSGHRTAVIRLDRPRSPVTRADIAAHREAVLAAAGPEQLERERRRLDALAYPESKAPLTALVAAENGAVWVREIDPAPGAESAAWSVLTSDGTLCARLALPTSVALRAAGSDWLLATVIDDVGVEQVRLYPLDLPAGCASGP
jgi:hypothetical protein